MKALYPIRMKHLFVLSFLLMSLLPSASITSYAAKASSPVPALFYDDADLEAAKQDLMNMIYECMKVLEDSHQALSEKATSDEAPELYQQVDEIAKYLDHARYQLDQVASIEELKDLQMMVMDIRKRLEELRYQIEEFEAANVFTATTIEGVEMTFKVISEEDKTCQVGVGTNENRAVDKNVSGTLTIPEKANGYTVISIGSYAFRECKNLTNVVLPVGITSIGNSSFSNCTGLQYINFPEGLKSIGESCFHTCSSLREINIPASLTSIGYVAFASCGSVTSISVAEGNAVFDSRNNCNAILVTSTNQLFRGCRNTRIPDEVQSLANCSFSRCPISSIQLPSNLISIGGWAFSGTGLEIVNIPEKVRSIGWQAFEGCANLTMVSLPASLTFIDDYAFCNCPKLTNIRSFIQEPFNVPEHTFVNYKAGAYNPSDATLTVPTGTKAKYEVTEGWNKFQNIVEVEAPEGNIEFADAAVKSLCVANWDTNGDGELSYAEATAVMSLGNVFRGNQSITTFDELQYFTSLVDINNEAFQSSTNLKSLIIPNSVKTINQYAFYGCHSLASLTIPKSVIKIDFAFGYNYDLASIAVEEGNTRYDSRNNCNAIIDSSTGEMILGCKNTIIPSSVTSTRNAFMSCKDLKSIVIPFGVKNIGWNSFSNCENLESVSIPNSLTIHYGYGVNQSNMIGRYAFNGCNKLTSVTIYMETPPAIYEETFSNRANATLYVPAGCKVAYESADYWKEFKSIEEIVDSNSPAYAVLTDDNSVLTFYFDDQRESRGGMPVSGRQWLEHKDAITTVVFDASFADCTTLATTAGWFNGCSSLTTIIGFENLKTENVANMSQMFSGCSKLTSLDLSSFKTDKAVLMSSMFYGCSSLTNLDLSGFNTENVADMSMMFQECSALKALNITGLNTSNVATMEQTFLGCSSLESLDLSTLSTENVRCMRWMFGSCSKLKTIDVSGFNTANVTSMGEMFFNCYGLTSLDLSGFDTYNVEIMWSMFSSCFDLKTIYVGEGWSTVKVTADKGTNMFKNCNSLVGGSGTTYNSTHIDYTYAHIDGGTSNPGYFTDVADAVFSDLCPDDHHPHMIDLGLPSGIRWACCNVGADKPGAHGDYFAWGETETKDSYSQDTYSFAFLGTDIAGTEYDVAHVKWGDLWAMPNLDHMNELLANCTYEPTSYDGVQGYKFTSKINGSSIFLPASGCRLGTEYVDTDQVGYYWTSNYSDISSGCASILSFHDNQAYCSSRVTREAGRSVRPIVGEASQRIFLHSKEVDGVTFALYRQVVNRFDIRKNYDGWEMYRTKVTLDITENGVTDTYLIDDALYEDVNSDGQIPCMMFDLENRMMYAFCLSKGEDIYYGMEGYVYSSPMDVVNFQKDQVFTYANWGWWTSFAGMNNGQPQLSHFSFAGYYRMASERNEDGSWTTDYIESIYPDNYKAYWQTQDLMLVLEQPVDIEPLENGDVIDFGDFVDESGVEVLPALDGNVVGNLYFNILNDNGGYDTEEGCIVITESTADETIERIADKDFYDKELRETFTGIIFKVPAGSGNIKITAEALGSMLLKVRIGGDEPQSFELDGRQKVKIPYTVSEETLVYIYAGEDAAVKGVHPVTASSGMLRIFGIESESIPTAIADVETNDTPVTIYSVSGQRLAKPQKGVNIIGGKKVVVK